MVNTVVIAGASGILYLDGRIVTPASDFAEMFETIDGRAIDPGYFVTLEGDKVRKANQQDEYILGVVSADPAFIANASELRWQGMFAKDEWGRVQYEDVHITEEDDEQGLNIPAQTIKQRVINPHYDEAREYVPRSERPEWVPVGIIGQLTVRDDGTSQVNGYCKPNEEGIATASAEGYRVMRRVAENRIAIFVK